MPLSFRFLFSFSVKVLLAYCGLRADYRYGRWGDYSTWQTGVPVLMCVYVCMYGCTSPFGLFSDSVSTTEDVSFEDDHKVKRVEGY